MFGFFLFCFSTIECGLYWTSSPFLLFHILFMSLGIHPFVKALIMFRVAANGLLAVSLFSLALHRAEIIFSHLSIAYRCARACGGLRSCHMFYRAKVRHRITEGDTVLKSPEFFLFSNKWIQKVKSNLGWSGRQYRLRPADRLIHIMRLGRWLCIIIALLIPLSHIKICSDFDTIFNSVTPSIICWCKYCSDCLRLRGLQV